MSETWSEHDEHALHGLCSHFGVATVYNDVWGNRKHVARNALLALLTEFDQRLDQAADIHTALEAARASIWHDALPPVVAIKDNDEHWGVLVRVAPDAAPLHWRLCREDGTPVHVGRVAPQELEQREHRQRAGIELGARFLPIDHRLEAGYYHLAIDGLPRRVVFIKGKSAR